MALNDRPLIALVPARGGSKGLPRKNLRLLSGQPMLEYTLRAALESRYVDQVVLSSDDPEILDLAGERSIQRILRPAEAASDMASADDVVRHLLSVLQPQQLEGDPYLMYLQPTSPLRTAAHIDAACAMLHGNEVHTLLSVVEMEKSPYKAFRVDGGRLQSLFDERLSNARRQDLPKVYLPNGAIYVFRVSDYRARGGFPSNGSLPYVMDAACSIDVDSQADIERVERALGGRNG